MKMHVNLHSVQLLGEQGVMLFSWANTLTPGDTKSYIQQCGGGDGAWEGDKVDLK